MNYLKLAIIAAKRYRWLTWHDREDMTGHILLAFSEHLAKGGDESGPLFTVIARRAAHRWHYNTFLRKRQIKCRVTDPAHLKRIRESDGVHVDEFYELIASEPRGIQRLLALYYRSGLNDREIAAHYRVSQQAICEKRVRALKRLANVCVHGH